MRERNVIFILIGIALIVLAGYLGAIYYLKISESKIPGVPAGTTSLAELKADYRSKIEIQFTGEKFPGSYASEPRLQQYLGKIKNNGDKIINNIYLKLEYLNSSGKPISEGKVYVNKTLRSGFIAEFQYGGVEVPAEWSGRVNVTIDDFSFVNYPN